MRSTLPAGAGLVVSKKAVRGARQEVRHQSDRHGPLRVRQLDAQAADRVKRFADYAGANKAFVTGPFFEAIDFLPIVNDSAAETALRGRRHRLRRDRRRDRSTASRANSRFQSISRNTLDYQLLGDERHGPDSSRTSTCARRSATPSTCRASSRPPSTASGSARTRSSRRTWASATGPGRRSTSGTSTRPRSYLAKTGLGNSR